MTASAFAVKQLCQNDVWAFPASHTAANAEWLPCMQVVQYADANDIDGDVDFGDMCEDDADDDFKAPGTSVAARRRLEPML